MAQLRTGRNLSPEVEALEKPDKLRAAVSPQDIRSYDEKRADWVAQPRGGDGLFGQLAQALSGYVPVLDRWSVVREQRFREEQTAEGKRLMQENKVAWKDFIAQKPEYAGLNPHLETGYKTAELEIKAQDYAAAIQNHYTTSGLMSETDPEKVRKAMNEFTKEWIEGNINREEFADSDIYNEAFYQKAVSAEAALMGRHTSDKAREHLRRAEDSFSTLVTRIMDDALMSAPGDPDGFNAALDTAAKQIMDQMKVFVDNGTPPSVTHEWAEKTILANAKAYGGEKSGDLGPRLLPLLDKVMTSDGPLGAKAANKAAVAMQEKQWENDRRQAASHGVQMWHFNRAKQADAHTQTLAGMVAAAANEGRTLTVDELRKAVPPEYVGLAETWFKHGSTITAPSWTPEAQRKWQEYRLDILAGKYSPRDLLPIHGMFPHEQWNGLVNLAVSVQEGNDPVTKVLSSDDMKRAHAQLASQMRSTFPDGKEDYNGISAPLVTEASMLLNDEVSVFIEGKTKKDGQPPSGAEIRLFLQEKAVEIGRMYAQRKAELEAVPETGQPIIIKTPEEVRSSFDASRLWYEPAWGRPDDKDKGAENAALAMEALTFAVRNPATAAPLFMNRFGLTAEQVGPFILEQLDMYGLKDTDLLEEVPAPVASPQWPGGSPW